MARKDKPPLSYTSFKCAAPITMGTVIGKNLAGDLVVHGDDGKQYQIAHHRAEEGITPDQRIAISRFPQPAPGGTLAAWRDLSETEFLERIERLKSRPKPEEIQARKEAREQAYRERRPIAQEEAQTERVAVEEIPEAITDDPEARLAARLASVTSDKETSTPFRDRVVIKPPSAVADSAQERIPPEEVPETLPIPETSRSFPEFSPEFPKATYREPGLCEDVSRTGVRRILGESGTPYYVRQSWSKGWRPAEVGDYGHVYVFSGSGGGTYAFHSVQPEPKAPMIEQRSTPTPTVIVEPSTVIPKEMEQTPAQMIAEQTPIEEAVTLEPEPIKPVSQKEISVPDTWTVKEITEPVLTAPAIDLADEAAADTLMSQSEEREEERLATQEPPSIHTRPSLIPTSRRILEVLRLKSEISDLQAQVQSRQARAMDLILQEWQEDRQRMGEDKTSPD